MKGFDNYLILGHGMTLFSTLLGDTTSVYLSVYDEETH